MSVRARKKLTLSEVQAANMAGCEVGDCVICGNEFIVETGYHRMGLCLRCAMRAGNEVYIAHSGAPDQMLSTDEEWAAYLESRERPEGRYRKADISDSLRWRVWERDNFTCKKCGARRLLSIDHIVPERDGGRTDFDNLQTLCRRCNSKKGRRQ